MPSFSLGLTALIETAEGGIGGGDAGGDGAGTASPVLSGSYLDRLMHLDESLERSREENRAPLLPDLEMAGRTGLGRALLDDVFRSGEIAGTDHLDLVWQGLVSSGRACLDGTLDLHAAVNQAVPSLGLNQATEAWRNMFDILIQSLGPTRYRAAPGFQERSDPRPTSATPSGASAPDGFLGVAPETAVVDSTFQEQPEWWLAAVAAAFLTGSLGVSPGAERADCSAAHKWAGRLL